MVTTSVSIDYSYSNCLIERRKGISVVFEYENLLEIITVNERIKIANDVHN